MITNDIGKLFSVMEANYGTRWTHGSDAIQVWLSRLKGCDPDDVMKAAYAAIDAYTDWPPSLGQFAALVRESTPRLPAPKGSGPQVNPDTVRAYTRPNSTTNPKGNPHGIVLPESIAERQIGESAEQYRARISCAVTLAMYPRLQAHGYE